MKELKEWKAIDSLHFPAMPDPKDSGKGSPIQWHWPSSGVQALQQIDPQSVGEEQLMRFPYALSVFDKDKRHLLTVVLEQVDYRMLSSLTGETIEELSGSSKKKLSDPAIGIYRFEGHETVGPYVGDLSDDTVFEILLDIVSEELDLWEDPLCTHITQEIL